MASKREDFTDRQKAYIFVRDRALCCFSGISLWLLDYGASPAQVNWADHTEPASRGGVAEIENGACASWIYNQYRSDAGKGVYLFFAGRPTRDFLILFEVVPKEIAVHLKRFRRLHFSDWYFDRAVFHTKLGAYYEEGAVRPDGKPYARGVAYRSKAALNCLTQWRKYVEQERPGTLESHGLLPANPSTDQVVLLQLFQARSTAAVEEIILALAPYCTASFDAIAELALVETAAKARSLLRRVRQNEYVTKRVKQSIALNVDRLWG